MELIEGLRTSGAVRGFTDDPVDDATVRAILDDARFAPSGGNRQPWRVAVIGDRVLRRRLGNLMQGVWNEYIAVGATGAAPFALGSPTASELPTDAVVHVPNPVVDHIEQAPVMLAIAGDRRQIALMDGQLDRPAMTNGGSIYPFCWSILLAARERGLGGVMTTFLSRAEPAAAPVLGLPTEYALAATIFLGHPVHQNTKLKRQPVEAFATVDRFDGAPFHG